MSTYREVTYAPVSDSSSSVCRSDRGDEGSKPDGSASQSQKAGRRCMHPYQIATLVTLGLTFFVLAGGLDRKSTRLNSSHVAISYAVFCLKKKSDNSQVCVA